MTNFQLNYDVVLTINCVLMIEPLSICLILVVKVGLEANQFGDDILS